MSRFNVKRLYEAANKGNELDRFYGEFQEALDNKEIRPTDFSFSELFEDLVEDGHSIVSQWRHHPESRMSLTEAGVSSTAFLNISGQLLVNKTLEAYNDPKFVSDQLCEVVPTRLPKGERIPGITQIGNEAEAIGEGQPYPIIGLGEDWIDTPETVKRGLIVPLTRECVVADLTGQLFDRASRVGEWIRYNREIRILQAALGITSSYNRRSRGVQSTYADNSGNHDWDNLQASNTLVDWTDIENAMLLFDGMLDPNTGTPIMVIPDTVVVPTALAWTAERILNATQIAFGDGASNTTRTYGSNPAGGKFKIVTSQLVYTVTSSTSSWFLGDFKRGVKYMEISPVQVIQAPTNSHDEFHRDIVAQWKASEWGVPAVVEPRAMVKSTT